MIDIEAEIVENPSSSRLDSAPLGITNIVPVGRQSKLSFVIGSELERAFSELGTFGQLPDSTPVALNVENDDFPVLSVSEILVAHALEEQGGAARHVKKMNHRFRAVVCATAFSRDRMIDAGLEIPVAVVGMGVDQWERTALDQAYECPGKVFKYVHLSGGEVQTSIVLDAFARVFDGSDPVSLIIRAMDHADERRLIQQVDTLRTGRPEFPDVIIVEDLCDATWKALLRHCHVYISIESCGRFQLPIAQALMMGVPAIALGRGGHLEYYSPQGSWLVACGATGIPVRASFETAIWEAYTCSDDERFQTAWSARGRLLKEFTWKDVAVRLARYRKTAESKSKQVSKSPTIGFLTTWNVKCGIGIYVEHMLSGYSAKDYTIFAARQEPQTRPDTWNVSRVWDVSKETNNLNSIHTEIEYGRIQALVIQFNYGFFNHSELASLIDYAADMNVPVFVDLHSTIDPYGDVPNYRLADFYGPLRRCQRVLVHSSYDFDRLSRIGVSNNVSYFPLGILSLPRDPNQKRSVGRMPVLASFGFCFESKGLLELVRAMDILRQRGERVFLMMLNAEYPNQPSRDYVAAIRKEIIEKDLNSMIDFTGDYIDDELCLEKISKADLFVNPYKFTNESASAATRYGLAASVPVLVTPLPIFSELGNAVFRSSGTTPLDLADAIQETLRHLRERSEFADTVEQAADVWRADHNYELVGERLMRTARAYIQRGFDQVNAG